MSDNNLNQAENQDEEQDNIQNDLSSSDNKDLVNDNIEASDNANNSADETRDSFTNDQSGHEVEEVNNDSNVYSPVQADENPIDDSTLQTDVDIDEDYDEESHLVESEADESDEQDVQPEQEEYDMDESFNIDGDESNMTSQNAEEIVEECIESNDKIYDGEDVSNDQGNDAESDQVDESEQDTETDPVTTESNVNKDSSVPCNENKKIDAEKPSSSKKTDDKRDKVSVESSNDPIDDEITTVGEIICTSNIDKDPLASDDVATGGDESHVVDIDNDDADSVQDDVEEISSTLPENGIASGNEKKPDDKKNDKENKSNEEEETIDDPLVAGAIVDLTEETDETNPSTSQNDDDDIVVLLEKTDSVKKKKPQPVPIYVKVNSNQKEKIITDSVDLMCLIQCFICKKNRREIRGHVRTAHKLDFEQYKRLHGETMHFSRLTYHRCKMCNKLIVYEFWNFRNHLRRSHNMDTVRYSLKYLEQKKKPKHTEQDNSATAAQAAAPTSFSNCVSEMCKFQCKICMQSFSFLPEHVKNHHNFGFPQYKEMFGNELQLTTVMYHKCNICQKILRFDRPTLQKHLAVTHKAKLGAYMKHYLSKKPAQSGQEDEPLEVDPIATTPASPTKKVKNLGKFKVSSSLTITKVRTNENGSEEAMAGPSGVGGVPVFPGRGRGRGRGGADVQSYANEPKIFTDNPDDMCLTMCRLCGAELKPKSLSNHLINQHQSNLVRYKEEFGKEITFTKLRYHKCKVCGKTLKFESKQLCYHLTSVHSMSFTVYKEQHLMNHTTMKRRSKGGGAAAAIAAGQAAAASRLAYGAPPPLKRMVGPNISRGARLMNHHPPRLNGGFLWGGMAGMFQAANMAAAAQQHADANVAAVLPDLYTPPQELGMDLSDESSSLHNSTPYHLSNVSYDSSNDCEEGIGIDPMDCLSVSLDHNGGSGPVDDSNSGVDQDNYDQQDQVEDVKDSKQFQMNITKLAETSSHQEEAEMNDDPSIDQSEDSILPDIDITENPIKIEPTQDAESQ